MGKNESEPIQLSLGVGAFESIKTEPLVDKEWLVKHEKRNQDIREIAAVTTGPFKGLDN